MWNFTYYKIHHIHRLFINIFKEEFRDLIVCMYVGFRQVLNSLPTCTCHLENGNLGLIKWHKCGISLITSFIQCSKKEHSTTGVLEDEEKSSWKAFVICKYNEMCKKIKTSLHAHVTKSLYTRLYSKSPTLYPKWQVSTWQAPTL